MATPTDEPTTDEEVRRAVLNAAADALEKHTHDPTGSGSYNRRRRYEAGFDAAMNALRPIAVEDRPDGLVGEVDDLVSGVRERGRGTEDVVSEIRSEAGVTQ